MTIVVVTANSIYHIDPVEKTWMRAYSSSRSGHIRTTKGNLVRIHECRAGRRLRMEVEAVPGTFPLSRAIITSNVMDVYVEDAG